MAEAGIDIASEARRASESGPTSVGLGTAAVLPPGLGDRLEVLFARLSEAGLWIGAREQIQATRLLAEVITHEQIVSESGKLDTSRLRKLLTPVLAKTPQQISKLREIFDQVFFDAGRESRPMVESVQRTSVRRTWAGLGLLTNWQFWLAALLLGAAVGLFVIRDLLVCPAFICSAPAPRQVPAPEVGTPVASQSSTASIASLGTTDRDNAMFRPLVTEAVRYVVQAGGAARQATPRSIAHRVAAAPGRRIGPGVILREIVGASAAGPDEPLDLARPETLALLVTVVIETLNRTIGGVDVAQVQAVLATLPAEQLRGEGPAVVTPRTLPADSMVAPNWLSAALAAIPLLWLAAFAVNWRDRRKAYLRRRKPEAAPFLHDLLVRTHEAVDEGRANLALATGRLEQRQTTGVLDLDADATVRRSIYNGGRFTPAWTPRRTKPLYIALIASQGSEDQEAQRLARLVDELDRMGLPVERYFMQHDANVCWQSPDGPFLSLEALADTHPDYRLVFLGAGEVFINPETNEPWPWTSQLARWELKTLLSPVPIQDWTAREARLAELFGGPLLTATSAGLVEVSTTFERAGWLGGVATPGEAWEHWSWVERPRRWLIRADVDDTTWTALRQELRLYLGRDDATAWRWLAACAIYPAVRWDLTVYLGLELRDGQGLALYTEARAARLAHLPWFRAGYMPDWLRMRLLTDREMPIEFRRRTVELVRDLIRGALKADHKAADGIRLRLATERGLVDDRRVDEAMQDEVFLDLLSSSDVSQLTPEANSLRALLADFVRRPWVWELGGLALGTAYALAALAVLPWESDGAMPTGAWLPATLLGLALFTIPATRGGGWPVRLARAVAAPVSWLAMWLADAVIVAWRWIRALPATMIGVIYLIITVICVGMTAWSTYFGFLSMFKELTLPITMVIAAGLLASNIVLLNRRRNGYSLVGAAALVLLFTSFSMVSSYSFFYTNVMRDRLAQERVLEAKRTFDDNLIAAETAVRQELSSRQQSEVRQPQEEAELVSTLATIDASRQSQDQVLARLLSVSPGDADYYGSRLTAIKSMNEASLELSRRVEQAMTMLGNVLNLSPRLTSDEGILLDSIPSTIRSGFRDPANLPTALVLAVIAVFLDLIPLLFVLVLVPPVRSVPGQGREPSQREQSDSEVPGVHERLRVFIAYSRVDMAIADLLWKELQAHGFEVMIDRDSIAAGEDWLQRLGALITAADTIVFVITPGAVASSVLAWELQRCQELSKRIIPVVAERVPPERLPEPLARLNWIYADDPTRLERALEMLVTALRTDLGWLREHTRLMELAMEWDRASRRDDWLLRGARLEEAKRWGASQPRNAPAATELHREFLAASERAESERIQRARR